MSDADYEIIRDNYLDLHNLLDCSYVLHLTLGSAATTYEELKKGSPKIKTEGTAVLLRQLEQIKEIDTRLNKLITDQLLLLEREQNKTVGDLLNKPKAVIREITDV